MFTLGKYTLSYQTNRSNFINFPFNFEKKELRICEILSMQKDKNLLIKLS
jgi:hypothetical protein